MGSLYLVEMVDVLEAAGVRCSVGNTNAGWERRARGSGGFDSMPLGIVWHHTASSASPSSDLSYMINGSDDAPIGNLLLDRDGVVWPIAAGGANTQGKGGPAYFSRGTCPVDNGNSRLFGMEVANAGTGEAWPQVQIDAYFAASNALNEYFGNDETDLITHHEWAPDRKIDPAKAQSVQGPWVPGSVSSSGTWNGNDIRDECSRRAGSSPPQPQPGPQPEPDDDEEYDMAFIIINSANGQPALVYGDGKVTGIDGGSFNDFNTKYGPAITVEPATFDDFANKGH
jgi:hypothetical protein